MARSAPALPEPLVSIPRAQTPHAPEPSSADSARWRHRRDAAVMLVVFGAALTLFLSLGSWIDPRMLERQTLDVWFQADIARVFENLTLRWSSHARTSHHPAFSLIGYSPTFVLIRGVGLEPALAARLVVALVGAAWGACIYLSLRWMGLRTLEALLFTTLGLTSASALAWFTVPETFSFGSLAIGLGALTVAAGTERLKRGDWDVLASAAMLATTKTNWAIGILASWVRHGWRSVPRIAVNAFALVVVLWSVQEWIFPDTGWFLSLGRPEAGAILAPDAMGVQGVVRSVLVHTIVFPAIAVVDFPNLGEWPLMVTQRSGIGSSGAFGLIASLGWMAVLCIGVYTALSSRAPRGLGFFLLAALGTQLVLHLLFGDETFLYSAHFLPLLVLLGALAVKGPWRRVSLGLAVTVVLAGGFNNVRQFQRATAFLDDWGAYRHSLRAAMTARPEDRWQREESTRFTATETLEGAWYGPGGSGYPVAGSFGINVWVYDPQSRSVVATSNDIPLDAITEEAIGTGEHARGWVARTPWYQTRWYARGPRDFELEISEASAPLELVIRGIAPRDPGPLREVLRAGDELVLNGRWRVGPIKGVVNTGVESGAWTKTDGEGPSVRDPGGWAYARIPIGMETVRLRIWDAKSDGPIGRVLGWIPAGD